MTKRSRQNLLFIFGLSLIFLIALLLRTVNIDLRPFHNDEGVNFYFIEQMRSLGYFKYSHLNYHGPAYFYLTALSTKLLGDGEFGMRFSAIIVGMMLLIQLVLLRKTEGPVFVILAALLWSLSSSLVFYSRYAIHESLFLYGGTLCAVSSYLWWRLRRPISLYAIGVALALLITTKETFIITLFCIFFAFFSLGDYRGVFKDLLKQKAHLFCSVLIMAFLVALIFSGGFQWYGGLREMFLAVPQWIGRNVSDTGHFKPFLYYTNIIIGPAITDFFRENFNICIYGGQQAGGAAQKCFNRGFEVNAGTEVHLLLALLIPLLSLISFPRKSLKYFLSEEGAFFRFTALWAILSLLVYSLVSYKTPWLIINITFPIILLLAVCLSRIISLGKEGMISGLIVSILVVGVAALQTYKFNFALPYGSQDFFRDTKVKHKVNIKNPFSYTHTHPGMLATAADIDRYVEQHPRARILVGVSQYWPLPYYLREHKKRLGYLPKAEPKSQMKNYQVMIIDSHKNWSHPGWAKKYYRLSDVQEAHLFLKRTRP